MGSLGEPSCLASHHQGKQVEGGSWVMAEPWAFCDPQSPPVGKAGNTSLCLLNHAVHWRLGGNPAGLGILGLGVKHYRGVVKVVAGWALRRQRPEAQGEAGEVGIPD